MKYRKKPILIDAVQWWPPGDPRHDPSLLSQRKGNQVDPPDYRQQFDLYQFSTIKGMGDDIFLFRLNKNSDDSARVFPGDWICTQIVNGQIDKWPCAKDIFAATYEAVVEP